MHADQVDIGVDVVRRLVAEQFPEWASLPVRPQTSPGTVNALFRLGDDFVLRFPLRPALRVELRGPLSVEQDNARRVASHVGVSVPEPIALGGPGHGYDGEWAVYSWIHGRMASAGDVGDSEAFARDLAAFVRQLHAIDTDGRSWEGGSRGGPLHTRDDDVRAALAASARLVDTSRIAALWERCLEVPRGDAADVWIHADLMPGNLLVRDGRLAGVLDFETLCLGDPAVDLMPAWNLLGLGARAIYRRELAVDDATWERGRGWAIVQAIVALPYYVDTNPAMADTARRTLHAVVE